MPVEPAPQTQTDWLCDRMSEVLDALRAIRDGQDVSADRQGALMATVNDVGTGMQGVLQALADLKAAQQVYDGKVDALLAHDQAIKGQLTPEAQATVDTLAQNVLDARQAIAEIGQDIAVEDAAVDAANPPAPAPAPAPEPVPGA